MPKLVHSSQFMVHRNKKSTNQVGFTLIELLVTITILSILATVSLVSYQAVNKNGRDSKRQSDLRLVQSALEQYNGDQIYYPTLASDCTNSSNIGKFKFGCPLKNPSGNNLYLNLIPNDPSLSVTSGNPQYAYVPKPDNCDNLTPATQCKSYCLFAILENSSTPSQLTSTCASYPSGGYNYLLTPP